MSRENMERYWRNPDPANTPEMYCVSGAERSAFLLAMLERHGATNGDAVLEAGCNIGRNLNHLFIHGYRLLLGIDINPQAIAEMSRVYSEMVEHAVVTVGRLEDVLPLYRDDSVDASFAMAVLEHVHDDAFDVVCDHLVRVTRRLIVVMEDEKMLDWQHRPHDYTGVFCDRGMIQLEALPCPAAPDAFGRDGFVAKAFKKV